jgi:hypothetical protein
MAASNCPPMTRKSSFPPRSAEAKGKPQVVRRGFGCLGWARGEPRPETLAPNPSQKTHFGQSEIFPWCRLTPPATFRNTHLTFGRVWTALRL